MKIPEFITISTSSLERGLEIREMLDGWDEEFFIAKISRYSSMIGGKVLWIVDGLSLDGDLGA